MFQFDQGQIGTLTPSPCSKPRSNWNTNPVPPVPHQAPSLCSARIKLLYGLNAL
ncbi:MAG: hypothetical protein FWE41_07585 [Coriobacteriia bacterium]|nr:hypothetical protein [Coriobacteriia bacterium]